MRKRRFYEKPSEKRKRKAKAVKVKVRGFRKLIRNRRSKEL